MWSALFQKRQKPNSSEPSEPALPVPFNPGQNTEKPVLSLAQIVKHEMQVVNGDQGKQTMVRLLEELDENRKTARLSSGTRLVALKTEAWDASQSLVRTLNPRLRQELESAYADIHLLNQLVWLASEFHRSSRAILSQYVNLSLVIAKKLDEIVESPRPGFTAE